MSALHRNYAGWMEPIPTVIQLVTQSQVSVAGPLKLVPFSLAKWKSVNCVCCVARELPGYSFVRSALGHNQPLCRRCPSPPFVELEKELAFIHSIAHSLIQRLSACATISLMWGGPAKVAGAFKLMADPDGPTCSFVCWHSIAGYSPGLLVFSAPEPGGLIRLS